MLRRLVLLIMLTPGAGLYAGTELGNGGDVIICTVGNTTTTELIDAFEARDILKLTPDFGGSGVPVTMALHALDRIKNLDPARYTRYAARVNSFDADARFLTNADLEEIDDTSPVVVPDNCQLKQLAVQTIDPLPGMPRYLIDADLWADLDEESRAYLVLHEVIYHEAIFNGQRSSNSSRYYLGFLASDHFESFSQTQYDQFLEDHVEGLPGIRGVQGLDLMTASLEFYGGGEIFSGLLPYRGNRDVEDIYTRSVMQNGRIFQLESGYVRFWRNGFIREFGEGEIRVPLSGGGAVTGRGDRERIIQDEQGVMSFRSESREGGFLIENSRGCRGEIKSLQLDASNALSTDAEKYIVSVGKDFECAMGSFRRVIFRPPIDFYADGSVRQGVLADDRSLRLEDESLVRIPQGTSVVLSMDGRVLSY